LIRLQELHVYENEDRNRWLTGGIVYRLSSFLGGSLFRKIAVGDPESNNS